MSCGLKYFKDSHCEEKLLQFQYVELFNQDQKAEMQVVG